MSILLKPYAQVASGRNVARFYLADCVEVLRQLPAESVDVIVTSPPYNLGIRYSRYKDTLSQADYLAWTDAWIGAAARVLRPDGSHVPERRRQAERPVDGARRRAGGARAPAAAEHHPLGEVDRDRQGVGRRRRRA